MSARLAGARLFRRRGEPSWKAAGPAGPPADIFAHWKASDLPLSNLDPVPTWPDSGPGGHDLAAVAAKIPEFRENVVNGQPVVFSNIDSEMEALFTTIPQPFTVAVVGSNETTSLGLRAFWGAHQPPNATICYFRKRDGNKWNIWAGAGGLLAAQWDVFGADANYHIFIMVFDGPDSILKVDGVEHAAPIDIGSHGLTNGIRVFRVEGGSWIMRGGIAELVIYPRRLDAAEREALTDDLNATYGLL